MSMSTSMSTSTSTSTSMAVAMAMVVAVVVAVMMVVVVAVAVAVTVAVAVLLRRQLVALQRPAAAVNLPAPLSVPHSPIQYYHDQACLPSVKTEKMIILIRDVDRVPIYTSSTENL